MKDFCFPSQNHFLVAGSGATLLQPTLVLVIVLSRKKKSIFFLLLILLSAGLNHRGIDKTQGEQRNCYQPFVFLSPKLSLPVLSSTPLSSIKCGRICHSPPLPYTLRCDLLGQGEEKFHKNNKEGVSQSNGSCPLVDKYGHQWRAGLSTS